jgi:hypothetical protein
MTIKDMIMNGNNRGMVLQGFFRVERFRAQATAGVASAAIVQPKAAFWADRR